MYRFQQRILLHGGIPHNTGVDSPQFDVVRDFGNGGLEHIPLCDVRVELIPVTGNVEQPAGLASDSSLIGIRQSR